MDAFEQLVSELYWNDGWWTQTSYKVNLTKEDKIAINRPSCPRWEIDVVAYNANLNELRAIECKSYFDSYGVNLPELQPASSSSNYKLFREENTREVVLRRLKHDMVSAGLIRQDTKVVLGLVAGKTRPSHQEGIQSMFQENQWIFHDLDWLKSSLTRWSEHSYSNNVAAIVAKIFCR